MTATVAPSPISSALINSFDPTKMDCVDARKRRREIVTLHRTTSTEDGNLSSSSSSSFEGSCVAVKKQRKVVVSDDETASLGDMCVAIKKPKPQMKYDPEVPMTKEEATAWRRDQRRRRNRESAAASRQRQRDRIDELEMELNHWKSKFEAVQGEIRALQDPLRASSCSLADTDRLLCTPKQVSSLDCSYASPTSSALFDFAGNGDKSPHEVPLQPKPIKMISRQA